MKIRMAASSRQTVRVRKARSVSRRTETEVLPAASLAWQAERRHWIKNPGMYRQDRTRSRVMDTKGIGNRAEALRQKVMRFKQPNQFPDPFPSLRHLPGISEGEGLRQGLVERRSFRWR
jgi:hypothetical protein